MAKLALFSAVFVALAILTAAEGDNTLQLRCQRELQETSLDSCRQVVDRQLAVQLQQPFFLPRGFLLRTGVRAQCCQQLRDISRECRAAAIRHIVRQYEHQAVVPLTEEPYYPGKEEEEQQEGGSYSYYPGETYPQQEQGWEQEQPGQGQGSYQPSQTYLPQQQEQEQGWYHPSQTYRPQQHQQGSYHPSQTYLPQQQQEEGEFYGQSTTHQQQQEGGFYGQSTTHQQQQEQQQGREDPYHLRITLSRHARQPTQHELGETVQQQEGQGHYCGRQSQPTGFGKLSSAPHFGSKQQAARLRVVAKARQVAAQLPAMCFLVEGSAFSAGEY